jgi:DNA-binding HxlR family transcriptional regulator
MARQHMDPAPTCPVARTVDLIGDRWSLLIVRDAFDGVRRFGDFQNGLGVARSVLTQRLKGLVEAGILQVQPASDGTSYQEYVLTAKGEGLFPVVVALRQWAEQHAFEPQEARSQLVDTATGQPLGLMQPISAQGQVIAPEQTRVIKKTL